VLKAKRSGGAGGGGAGRAGHGVQGERGKSVTRRGAVGAKTVCGASQERSFTEGVDVGVDKGKLTRQGGAEERRRGYE